MTKIQDLVVEDRSTELSMGEGPRGEGRKTKAGASPYDEGRTTSRGGSCERDKYHTRKR